MFRPKCQDCRSFRFGSRRCVWLSKLVSGMDKACYNYKPGRDDAPPTFPDQIIRLEGRVSKLSKACLEGHERIADLERQLEEERRLCASMKDGVRIRIADVEAERDRLRETLVTLSKLPGSDAVDVRRIASQALASHPSRRIADVPSRTARSG